MGNPALLMLDEATSALDAETQKKVAASLRGEQKRLGFTVVQIAHRLETLQGSDIVYFMIHGRVVEIGGKDTLNGTAIDELLKVPIEYGGVEDPETGDIVQKLKSGHFHKLWNVAHDIVEFDQMETADLRKKLKDLEDELAKVKKKAETKTNMD